VSRRTTTYYYQEPLPRGFIVAQTTKKQYSFLNFMWDLFMLFVTGGLWIIWIIIRTISRR